MFKIEIQKYEMPVLNINCDTLFKQVGLKCEK